MKLVKGEPLMVAVMPKLAPGQLCRMPSGAVYQQTFAGPLRRVGRKRATKKERRRARAEAKALAALSADQVQDRLAGSPEEA